VKNSQYVTLALKAQRKRNVFKLYSSVDSEGADRTITGRLFQALGPATANARWPRIVRVLGTYNWPVSAERSRSEHLDEGG